MPQQLIYTSAPRGVVAGRSGHCTVARTAAMREALMLQLEKLSYYQHLSLSGGQERCIHACRIVDIRGSRFHVLSRIQDAGLDFTGRTNFLAHHLIFTPEEIRQFPAPAVTLRDWPGWVRTWAKEPQLFATEEWSSLTALAAKSSVPAQNWQRVTGDAVNGYGLLEARAGIAFRVDELPEETILTLFAESLELLELRDARRDFRATAWQYTFTTSMQEQDNPADFRWRCLHSDNPASSRFAGPDCCPLSAVRVLQVTGEETAFARSGRQSPRFVIQPQKVRVTEGESARFNARAEGVPSPNYQWFALDRAGNGQVIANGDGPELEVQNPPLGISRYVVRASNSAGDATSEVATLSVEPQLRLSQPRPVSEARAEAMPIGVHVKSADDIERQRRRLEAEQAEVRFEKGQHRRRVLVICATSLALLALAGTVILKFWPNQSSTNSEGESPRANSSIENIPVNLSNSLVNQSLILGSTNTKITFPLTAGGTPPLSFQWKHNGTNLPAETNSSLVLAPAKPAQAGQYAVTVSNAFGVTNASARLALITPPIEPLQKNVFAGNAATFSITMPADSLGYVYRWQMNGVDIRGATNASLRITNASALDNCTNYTVVVSWGGQSATSAPPAELQVRLPLQDPKPQATGQK